MGVLGIEPMATMQVTGCTLLLLVPLVGTPKLGPWCLLGFPALLACVLAGGHTSFGVALAPSQRLLTPGLTPFVWLTHTRLLCS